MSDINSDEFLLELLKKYRLAGFYSKEDNKETDIKTGRSENKLNVLEDEELNSLLGYMDNLVSDLTKNLIDGETEINPYFYNGQDVSCQYCIYKDICRFTPSDPSFSYREIEDMNKNEFFDQVKGDTDSE